MRKNTYLKKMLLSTFGPSAKIFISILFYFLLALQLVRVANAGSLNTFDLDETPSLDLNGPDMTGTGYATTFTEDGGPVPIVGEFLTILPKGINIHSATIWLKDYPDGSDEMLGADVSNTSIQSDYNKTTGVLKLTVTAPAEEYESVLKTITYENGSDAPHSTTDREIFFVVSDGTKNSNEVSSIVAIQAVNDAPLLDSNGDMHLNPIEEDDQTQIGNLVSTIIASAEQQGQDRITDPDYPQDNAPEGMAVIEVGDSNGTWEYSIDSGSTWSSFGTVNNGSAVLLDESSRIRFVPDANYNGIASFIFRAWDQTTVKKAGERADASITGETSAFSEATESVSIDVLAVNSPPVVDLNGKLPGEDYVYNFLTKNHQTPLMVPLTAPDAFVFDLDSTELESLTLTLTNRPDGDKEYLFLTTPVVGNIVSSIYDPSSGVLELKGKDLLDNYNTILKSLRYVNEKDTINSGARIIEFIANDGTNNSLLRTTTLIPYLSNNAPDLDSSLPMHFSDIDEDDMDPVGNSIDELMGTAESIPISDPDPDPERGFAVVGVENENGAWQFSIDGGVSWLAFGEVTDQAAVLLDEQAKIRFLPELNFSGKTRSVIVRAWDKTEGANGLSGFDTTQNGDGFFSFSESTSTIPIYIRPINDAPLLSITNNTIAQFIEGNGPVIVAGPAIEITDVDNDMLQSATITISNLIANEPDILVAATNGSGISANYDESTGILSLRGEGSLADYQSLLRLITFNNISQDPAIDDRIISFNVSDADDTSNDVSSIVRVEAVNDPPLLDLNGSTTAGLNETVYYDKDGTSGGGYVPLSSALQISDPDSTTLVGATVLLENKPDGISESLTIDTLDSNIAANFQDNNRKINLSGQASLVEYQEVLRTVIYVNKLSKPNRAVREISFTVQDASLGKSMSITKVVIRPQFVFMPVLANHTTNHPTEEPNDSCEEAVPIGTNFTYEFMADDVNDWFSFTLFNPATITVELTDFGPKDGQILVAQGTCGTLQRLGHNGDYSTTKTIQVGELESGRYYIWLINDGATDLEKPYKLQVKVAN